jgi:transposase InsO family protein
VVDDFCEKYATPLVVYSDRGTQFVGQKMQAYRMRKGIKHVASPSASPKSTGMVEVHNGLLEERIQRLLAAEPSREWDQLLLHATRALNTREVRVHGYSPFQLLFGISPRLNLPGDNPVLSEIRGNAALLA